MAADTSAPQPQAAPRNWLKGIALIAVSASLLTFVLTRVDLARVGRLLLGADPLLMAALLVFSLASAAVLPTIRWRITLRAMGYSLTFRQLLVCRLGAQPLKFSIPLKGGEAFRALYLRRRHGVPITAGLASILFDMFLVAIGQLSFLCVGALLAGSTAIRSAVLPTFALFGLALILSSRHLQELGLRVARAMSQTLHDKLAELAHGFLRFPLHKKIELTAISLLVEFTEVFAMVICMAALGLSVPTWAIFVYMPVVMGLTLIPVTLRGLGTRELAVVMLFGAFASPEELTSAAVLFTVVEFVLPALIGCFFLSSFLSRLAAQPAPERGAEVPDPAPGPVWTFLATNKRWWLLPAVLIFLGFALLLLFTSTGDVSPFVY